MTTRLFITTLCLVILSACAHKEYEHLQTTTDTVRVYHHHKDSVVHKDSVFVHIHTQGDTVYHVTERWNIRYNDRVRIDTVYKAKEQQKQETKTEVRKETPTWQYWFMIGLMFLVIVILIKR